jgi:IstB-like ATP binding protein
MSKSKSGERLPYLLGKLKAPRVLERLEQTAALAREQSWPYERFLETLLEAAVFARDASGARMRIRHGGFPALKSLDDFDWSAQPSAEKPLVLHLAQLAWIEERANVCFFGPPPRNGSPASRPPRTATSSSTSCAGSSATTFCSSTRSATCRSNARPPTCCLRSSRAATSAARSSSPRTAASSNGARSSATRWSPRPDRPARPPRDHDHAQGQELPPARARPRRRDRRSGSVAPRLRLSGGKPDQPDSGRSTLPAAPAAIPEAAGAPLTPSEHPALPPTPASTGALFGSR